MIKTILVDDEPIAVKHLSAIITRSCPQLEIIGTAASVEEAIDTIKKLKPELALLDIELAGQSSFEILENNENRSYEVIFVTAHEEFGIKAVKQGALDYILKPLNKTELINAVEKATLKIYQKRSIAPSNASNEKTIKPLNNRLALPTMEGLIFIDTNQLMYCESEGRYTRFHLSEGDRKILVSKNLGEYELILPSDQFIRIHNHTIVNLQFVDKYIKGRGGYVILKNGKNLQVSSRKKDDFFTRFE